MINNIHYKMTDNLKMRIRKYLKLLVTIRMEMKRAESAL